MKILPLLLFALGLPTGLRADDDDADVPRAPKPAGAEEKTLQDPRLVNALKRLEERLGIKFTIPFPKNFDVDAHKRQPLAVLAVDGGKVCIIRPMLNPFDEPRTVEWMMGPEDPDKLGISLEGGGRSLALAHCSTEPSV